MIKPNPGLNSAFILNTAFWLDFELSTSPWVLSVPQWIDFCYVIPVDDLFKTLKILKFDDLYTWNIGKYMFRFHNEVLPGPLQNLFTRNRNIHQYERRHMNDAPTPFHRLSLTHRSLGHQGPKKWSQIPETIKTSCSNNGFKQKFKANLLNKYIEG